MTPYPHQFWTVLTGWIFDLLSCRAQAVGELFGRYRELERDQESVQVIVFTLLAALLSISSYARHALDGSVVSERRQGVI